MYLLITTLLLLVSCTHQSKIADINKKEKQQPEWILKSNMIAEEFTKDLAKNSPEVGSEVGFSEYDKLGFLLDEKSEDRDRKTLTDWQSKIQIKINGVQDLELKTDFEVLQKWLISQIESMDTYKSEHAVEFQPGVKNIYYGLQSLVNPQSSHERKYAAVDRFKVYVNGDSAHLPLLEAMQKNFQNKVILYKNRKSVMPFKGEVEQYLKDSQALLVGIEELLKESGRNDWQQDWEKFKVQANKYEEFIKKEVLPKSKIDPRIPYKIYVQILKRRGIDSTPQQLIEKGLSDYKIIYKDFQKQAKQVAKQYGLVKSDPASVIKFLKSKPITQAKEVEQLYITASQRLDHIMRDNNIISVPASALRIRLAGEAESRSAPVPHLNQPPLVNNKGERPEFVVPSSEGGLPFDDFSSPHSAMILTAHEGRPGHDMQFSQMLDNGVSMIRSSYAANNVNIEGWALYAEDLVFNYLSPEEKLFAIQTRLWRVARMYLDPQIQLGRIKDQKVIDVFTKELGVSKVMANLELRRYKFADIGQAPSYYEGYLIVKKMKEDIKNQLGEKFDLKCFNDRLLSYGLLPLKFSAERMKQDLPICR